MSSLLGSIALRTGLILPALFVVLSCYTVSCFSPIGKVNQLEQETAILKAEIGSIQTKLIDGNVSISSDSITTTIFIAGGIALVVAVLSFLTYTSSHRFQFLRDVIDMIKGKKKKDNNNNGS